VFNFFLKLLFQTSSAPIIIYGITIPEMRTGTQVGLHDWRPVFLTDFNKNCNYSKTVNENPSISIQVLGVDTKSRTDKISTLGVDTCQS
jgi:hypothetical protein